jgi:hypothetical protein
MLALVVLALGILQLSFAYPEKMKAVAKFAAIVAGGAIVAAAAPIIAASTYPHVAALLPDEINWPAVGIIAAFAFCFLVASALVGHASLPLPASEDAPRNTRKPTVPGGVGSTAEMMAIIYGISAEPEDVNAQSHTEAQGSPKRFPGTYTPE